MRGWRVFGFLLLGVWLTPAGASGYLARAPVLAVLRGASPDILTCRDRHHLEAGRYQVSLIIDPTGKVHRVQLVAGPSRPDPAAESCLAAAFTRLRFETGYALPAAREGTRTGNGRVSRVPPDGRTPRVGTIVINWPFVLTEP